MQKCAGSIPPARHEDLGAVLVEHTRTPFPSEGKPLSHLITLLFVSTIVLSGLGCVPCGAHLVRLLSNWYNLHVPVTTVWADIQSAV